MDGIDKLYTLQKQAGKSVPNKILDWLGWLKKVDVPVSNTWVNSATRGRIPIQNVNRTATRFDAKAALTDVALVSAVPTGYGVCAYMAPDPTTDAAEAATTADPATTGKTDTTGKTGTTADPATTGKTDTTGKTGTTADPATDAKLSIYDLAVNWIKENPWLAAAVGAGGLGLGYYAFSDDEEDEEK